jgi:pyruvate formate lyase activating enzyme
MKELAPGIFDIYRGSFVDGPGIRTVIFFSGCPLRCSWCQNPESWFESSTTLTQFTPEELTDKISCDQTYFDVSKGGVTFSGGEPLFYPQYLREVCLLLKKRGIHSAVETSGYFEEEVFTLELDSLIDLFIFDFKIINPDNHIIATGVSNERILHNARRLSTSQRSLVASIPLIKEYTANKENLSDIAAFLQEIEIEQYELRPYNPSCIDKQVALGLLPAKLLHSQPFSIEEEIFLNGYFRSLMKTAGKSQSNKRDDNMCNNKENGCK